MMVSSHTSISIVQGYCVDTVGVDAEMIRKYENIGGY